MDSRQAKLPDLKAISLKYQVELKRIKVFLTDVDGILTDGRVYYSGSEVGFNRWFHIRDGYGFKILKSAGIKVGFISGGKSLGLEKRAEVLKLDYVFLGNEDKREAYLKVLADGYKDEEICYLGDEFFDIPLLKRAGFSASVSTASPEVKEASMYICHTEAGMGVAREVCELIRYAQGIIPPVQDF
jgi:3-deoxy-D-manno-octulosonate 8-phosphate phosphatase (KDO 8-P phosphatase)